MDLRHWLSEKANIMDGELYYYVKITSYAEFIVVVLVLFLSSFLTFKILVHLQAHLTIQPAGVNPLKKINQVLKYTWKRKIPKS